jgi:RND family efflux transporter MFP subunit
MTTARIQDDAQAVGGLRSRQSVMLQPEVAGRVVKIGFDDGSRVKRGQLLVQLDDVLPRAELSQAQAQLSIARANLQRNQDLVAQNFVAQRVLDESQANLQVAEAQVALAQARLQRMRFVAPFDGTVGLRRINLGEFVKDGANLVNLEDTSALTVGFRLPERYQSRIAVGQTVQVRLDALPGKRFDARVQALDPLLDADGRSIAVRATILASAGDELRPGMFACVLTVFAVDEAALVIFVLLRTLRASIIPLVTIPVSLIGTFALMALFGFSINTLTLLALVLAIGLVVDDAIVVLENIHRHIENGMQPFEASIRGAREVGFAVIAMTLTLDAIARTVETLLGGRSVTRLKRDGEQYDVVV